MPSSRSCGLEGNIARQGGEWHDSPPVVYRRLLCMRFRGGERAEEDEGQQGAPQQPPEAPPSLQHQHQEGEDQEDEAGVDEIHPEGIVGDEEGDLVTLVGERMEEEAVAPVAQDLIHRESVGSPLHLDDGVVVGGKGSPLIGVGGAVVPQGEGEGE